MLVGSWLLYTVKPGETVWSIADKFDVNPGEMIAANELAGLKAVYSGQSLVIPDFHGKFQREILGYLPVQSAEGLKDDLPQALTSVSPCWVEVSENGSIRTKIDLNLLEEAKQKRLKIYIHVQSVDFEGSVADHLLEKTQNRHRLLHNLRELLEEHHLTGVNLHIKNISSHNRDYLNRLVQECALSLRQDGFGTIVTLPAKTGDSGGNQWANAYDYHVIGKSVDYVVIETYDFHSVDGHPGPIAPVFWIKDVIDYALMEIPEEKIILGLPCYGYDWVITGRKRAQKLTYQRAVEMQESHRAETFWDLDAITPYYYYFAAGEEHQVWYENRESLFAKMALVKKYHLGGVAFWMLGDEDKSIWRSL